MKITVTGAVGRLGQVVVKALHAEGHDIVATDQCYSRELPVRVDVLDLHNAEGCYSLLEGSDALVHLANNPGFNPLKPQVGYLNNVAANVNVFQAARDTGVGKIIFASSIQTCAGARYLAADGTLPPSGLAYLPLDDQLPPNPSNLYGSSKIAAENLLNYYAKVDGISTVSIRFPALIVPSMAQFQLQRIQNGISLDEGFAYLALPDAAELVSATVKADLPGFRIYLPASLGTIKAPMSLDEIVAQYYPEVPRRAFGKFDNLVDLTAISRDTGWIPQHRLYPA